MYYIIKVETTDDLKLLKKMFSNAMQKVAQGTFAYTEQADSIERLHEAIQAATQVKEKSADLPLPALCPEHKNYSAQRPPRTDCKVCWSQYKRLNPLKYDQARRIFTKSRPRERKNG